MAKAARYISMQAKPCDDSQTMSDDFQSRVTAAMANPQHMGELPNADAIGTVGNADCEIGRAHV